MSARGGFCAEVCPGGHIGPPLRGTGGVWEPTEISVKRSHSPTGRDGARPLQGTGAGQCVQNGGVWSPRPTDATQVVPSEGPMWASAPTPRGGRGNGTPGSSCPTGGCGEPPRLPWAAAHSGVSAAWSQGMGKNRSMDHPQMGHQRRTIPQSRPLAVPAPFTQGSLRDVGIRPFLTMDGDSGRRGRRPLRKVYRSPSNGPM